MEYVCGFMFSEDKKKVLLIQKDRPKWQVGRLNGVGGKIEEGDKEAKFFLNSQIPIPDYSLVAMIREFEEEVGIKTNPEDWELFAISEGSNSKIYNFRAFSDKIFDYKQMESEIPVIVQPRMLVDYPTVSNLQFLIPMALYTKELFNIKCQIKG